MSPHDTCNQAEDRPGGVSKKAVGGDEGAGRWACTVVKEHGKLEYTAKGVNEETKEESHEGLQKKVRNRFSFATM
jgi:hypothetical protein